MDDTLAEMVLKQLQAIQEQLNRIEQDVYDIKSDCGIGEEYSEAELEELEKNGKAFLNMAKLNAASGKHNP